MTVLVNTKVQRHSARRRRRSPARKAEQARQVWGGTKLAPSIEHQKGVNETLKIAELVSDEKQHALRSRNKRDLFVLGVVNLKIHKLVLWRGDWSKITVPLSAFK